MNSQTNDRDTLRRALPLMLLCWLIYSVSYMGKVDYSANVSRIEIFYGVSHAEAGLVSTLFFFSYGIGQVVNAVLVKKYNLKWVVFLSLISSVGINLSVGLVSSFAIIKYLWVVNGFALSLLWPSLIRLLAESLPSRLMPRVSVIMGTTVATGTLLIYGLSSVFALFTDFRLSFITASLAMLTVALIWIICVPKAVSLAKSLPDAEDGSAVKETSSDESPKPLSLRHAPTIMLSVCTLALFGVATNLIKDGVVGWIPSILKDVYGMGESVSIILALALPIVSIFGSAFSVAMNRWIEDLVKLTALFFLISGIAIGAVIAMMRFNVLAITLICFTLVSFLISACNGIITSLFPLSMKKKLNSGSIAGILNCFCYLGSAISSYGLGSIADGHGWVAVFFVLLSVCGLVCLCGAIYSLIKLRLERSEKNEIR